MWMQRFQQMHWSSVKRWNVPSSFIPSKNPLSISWAPLTVLTGYSRPQMAWKPSPVLPSAKSAPRMTTRLRQSLHGPWLLFSIFRDWIEHLMVITSKLKHASFSSLLYFLMAQLLFSCKWDVNIPFPFPQGASALLNWNHEAWVFWTLCSKAVLQEHF